MRMRICNSSSNGYKIRVNTPEAHRQIGGSRNEKSVPIDGQKSTNVVCTEKDDSLGIEKVGFESRPPSKS